MMYDPCTCIYKSKLNILSDLIASSQITLEGGITGDIYTKDVGGKAQIQKDGSFGWKDFSGLVNGKVSTVYNGINGFVTATQGFATNIGNVDTANKKSALDNLGNFLKNNSFLKAGLNAVPWLKSAVSLIDIFTGGGKTTTGPTEVKLLPLAVNLSVKLNGTISTVNPYHNIIFTNPGSKDAQLDPDAYPYYNEVLGVFNLIKTPVAFKTNNGGICDDNRRAYGTIYDYKFRFDADSLFYVLNGAAGLTIQNMKAAIIVKARPIVVDTTNMTNRQLNASFPFFEGKDAIENTYKFRTDYFDMKCLDREILSFKGASNTLAAQHCNATSNWNINADTLYLKFMINLKRNNTTPTSQNVLLVLTYPMKTVTDAVLVNTPTFATCDSTLLNPASATFVNTFCNSTTYNNIDRQSRAYLDSITIEKAIEKNGIGLYPNPNKGQFNVRIKEQNANLVSFYIVDMLGRNVYRTTERNIDLSNGLIKQININLKSGTYILTAITTKGRLKTKLIVID